MSRPPSDRVDEGFQIWSTEADRNDTRTAELMGLPSETISDWRRTYKWDGRYLAEMQLQGEIAARLARAKLRALLPAGIDRLRYIIEARKPVTNKQGQQIGETWAAADRDAVQAFKLLTQFGLAQGADQDIEAIDADSISVAELSPSRAKPLSLAEQASAILVSNIQSADTRPQRRRRA